MTTIQDRLNQAKCVSLGNHSQIQSEGYQHAIVVGSSVAGLLAARVLAEHFSSVTVLERAPKSATAVPRPAVPQGKHAHLLLKSGELILRELFPTLVEELVAHGTTVADVGADFRWLHHGHYKLKYDSGFKVLVQSRPLLEHHIRSKVEALSNVTFLYEASVSGFATTANRSNIVGVHVKQGSKQQCLQADLVVDASGPGSRTPAWLTQLGYQAPPKEQVEIGLSYSSLIFEQPEILPSWKGMVLYPKAPAQNRMGYIFPIENGRWLVTLASYLNDDRPKDKEDFLAFARSLPTFEIYNAIQSAKPISSVSSYHVRFETRHHYERLTHIPGGLVVLGDALCRFDPIYGQGMSVAAKEAMLLGKLLVQAKTNGEQPVEAIFAKTYFKQAANIVNTPWQLATTEAFRYPQIAGKRPFGTALMHWYTSKIFEHSASDPVVYSAFQQVLHLLKEPSHLLSPSILWRVIKFATHRALSLGSQTSAQATHKQPTAPSSN